ncbi:hypothetical protein [Geodermatophilus obscurus]|uniref:hypothetical protein n=1 Tax=Geodermatophilus obscurus TaxID=1861 RepID=UPI000933568C|nr:hypothetical protein [Geodermatophilus obscurus]
MRRADEPDDRRTLERRALTEWPEQAGAQVRSVAVAGDRAEVTLTVNGHHDYWVYYRRGRVGREERVSGNGPTLGWEDPSAIGW